MCIAAPNIQNVQHTINAVKGDATECEYKRPVENLKV